jgi:hypothetical protein
MPYHPTDRGWRSMQSERELMELAKTKSGKVRKLDLSIKRNAKLKC